MKRLKMLTYYFWIDICRRRRGAAGEGTGNSCGKAHLAGANRAAMRALVRAATAK